MKTKFSLLAVAVLACGLLTGCITSNNAPPLTPEQKSEQTVRRAKRITEMAAFDAGVIFLKDKNNTAENRAVLAGITNQLNGFATVTNATIADVATYISQLPIPQLKTAEGQLIAGGVITVVDEVLGEKYTIDASKIGPVASSAATGFARALAFAEANPYVAKAPKPPKDINGVTPPPK